ncbi:hypothetical protein HYZ70_00960 [Candidatus Curtissbacteria bacterium]|nr:hypothetical protein [Candidatus Curtissbacteria bacterium]
MKIIKLGFLGLLSLGLVLLVATYVKAGDLGPGDAHTDGPSAFCHVTDGVFTSCPDGKKEWSDIDASFFDVFVNAGPDSALYVDQADLEADKATPESDVDTLMLMYDEMFRTTPLLTGESVHVHFMTVDEGALVHYDVLIDGTGVIEVRINGVLQDPMPSGLTGKAGYGPSPNNPSPHVMAELQIGLEAAGFTSEECCYSPDPAWWGSDVPQNPEGDCLPHNSDNNQPTPPEPRDCVPGEPVSTTAGIFTAHLDGKTTVDPEPLLSVGDEPPLCDSIKRIVDFRARDESIEPEILSLNLVGSQEDAGLISKDEARVVLACVSGEGRMTGGGTVLGKALVGLPTEVKHGFELHCTAADLPNRLEVNWGKGNKFHLETLTHSVCLDNPAFGPNPPAAGFDTYVGRGTGRYNGVPGATAKWIFTDHGEPGKSDTARLVIKDVGGTTVVDIIGTLKVGNHQAHAH